MDQAGYLLDTDTLISMLRGQHGIREIIIEAGFSACAVSIISIAELQYGAFKSGNSDIQEKEISFIERNFRIVPFDGAEREYGRIRAQLETSGERIDNMDLMIAATAIRNGMTVVTHNTRHYSRIQGLETQDWIGNPDGILEELGITGRG